MSKQTIPRRIALPFVLPALFSSCVSPHAPSKSAVSAAPNAEAPGQAPVRTTQPAASSESKVEEMSQRLSFILVEKALQLTCMLLCLLALASPSAAQQMADKAFAPPTVAPAFSPGEGPIVLVDEAHNNFHTISGRYRPFAKLLESDGFVVRASSTAFTSKSLKKAQVLVISNATSKADRFPFPAPVHSAFTGDEIKSVQHWVERGGALLLIVDHYPWPEMADGLAKAFGISFHPGTAWSPTSNGRPGPTIFQRTDGSLLDHAITRGMRSGDRVEQVATFTGSAFRAKDAEPMLRFVHPKAFALKPLAMGKPPGPKAPRTPITGWLQGAVLHRKSGRVAVFGEAAAFTAQVGGPQRQPMGMNAPEAKDNARLVLNVMRWLAGALPENGK